MTDYSKFKQKQPVLDDYNTRLSEVVKERRLKRKKVIDKVFENRGRAYKERIKK